MFRLSTVCQKDDNFDHHAMKECRNIRESNERTTISSGFHYYFFNFSFWNLDIKNIFAISKCVTFIMHNFFQWTCSTTERQLIRHILVVKPATFFENKKLLLLRNFNVNPYNKMWFVYKLLFSRKVTRRSLTRRCLMNYLSVRSSYVYIEMSSDACTGTNLFSYEWNHVLAEHAR